MIEGFLRNMYDSKQKDTSLIHKFCFKCLDESIVLTENIIITVCETK